MRKYVFLILYLLLLCIFCSSKGGSMIRESAVAGYFYPAAKEELKNMVDNFLSKAEKIISPGEKVLGGIAPHAGYIYSGQIAGFTYKNLSDDIKTVIIIGPKHGPYKEGIFVYPTGKWKTPLGEIKIDDGIVEELVKNSKGVVTKDELAHNEEHSIEVQIPFLQERFANKVRIVPVVVRTWEYEKLQKFGDALFEILKTHKDVAVIVSTDLYHGYSYEDCVAQDRRFIEYVKNVNPQGLYKAMEVESTMACGGGGVVALLYALKRLYNVVPVFLRYTNSNDVMGKRGGYVVGYVSFVFVERKKEEGKLSIEEKRELIKIARKSIEEGLQGKRYVPVEPQNERLRKFQGAFVTLKEHGRLRGCIGYIEGIKPLYLTVAEVAYAAAFEDPRFPPLKKEEFSKIEIEITVLSPLRRIKDPKEVVVGKHGVLIRRGFYQGVLLPQVPIEEGWDRETFLAHTCLKAGLSLDCWKDPSTEIYVFTGEVFSEKEVK